MSEEKKTVELKEEDLEKVSGGSGTYNGVTYKDGDIFVKRQSDLYQNNFMFYVLENCNEKFCDCIRYSYSNGYKTYWRSAVEWTQNGYSMIVAYGFVKVDHLDGFN